MNQKQKLLELIDQYAEARHIQGHSTYNIKTAAARQAVIEALSGVQALSAAPAGWKLVPVEPTADQEWAGKNAALRCSTMGEACKIYKAMLAASPTTPAEQQAAPKAAPVKACVCGEPQASSTVHRVDGPCYVAAPQQEAQEPCPTCAALARTVMLDQVSFDRKPDCYGIRQITDDEGVEEWEDIRTSPDVAREEANDMMATGRGEIYEVVPLWTTPQPAPAPLSDDTERLNWLLWKLPGNALRYVVGELADTSSGAEFRAAIDTAIAAQGGKV